MSRDTPRDGFDDCVQANATSRYRVKSDQSTPATQFDDTTLKGQAAVPSDSVVGPISGNSACIQPGSGGAALTDPDPNNPNNQNSQQPSGSGQGAAPGGGAAGSTCVKPPLNINRDIMAILHLNAGEPGNPKTSGLVVIRMNESSSVSKRFLYQ